MSALLELREVEASYGPVRALHGVTLEVGEGELVSILGANGAGKTTTLRAICGMLRPRGRVRFAGEDIRGRTTERIVRLGIAHVPEGRGTFSTLTVLENLRLGAWTRRGGTGGELRRVFEFFPRLEERRDQQAGTLSGGEQQMLALARARLGRPKLLLLDEPSLGLAPLVVQEFFRVVRRLNADEGLTVLVVEQNANIALDVSHRAYVLEVGRVALEGASAELREHEGVRSSYLGY